MPRSPSSPQPRTVMEVDWPFFGELCRGLALKVSRDYQPDLVVGIARAGVIPGAHLLTSDDKYDVAKELPRNKSAKLVFYCADLH